jgi:hypothetical protein
MRAQAQAQLGPKRIYRVWGREMHEGGPWPVARRLGFNVYSGMFYDLFWYVSWFILVCFMVYSGTFSPCKQWGGVTCCTTSRLARKVGTCCSCRHVPGTRSRTQHTVTCPAHDHVHSTWSRTQHMVMVPYPAHGHVPNTWSRTHGQTISDFPPPPPLLPSRTRQMVKLMRPRIQEAPSRCSV